MSPLVMSVVAVSLFLLLTLNGMPIAFCFAFVGTAGLIYYRGIDAGLSILAHTPFAWGTELNLLTLPLFILMGQFAFHSEISRDLYVAADRWMGRLPGGLAMATNLAATFFAACCGVSMAGVATMATIAYPEMKKYNYSPRLATGCMAAGGGLSSLIPPSIGFIIFGFLTNQSIAKLLIAGILPGVMLSLLFLMVIYVMCKRNPSLGPRGQAFAWVEKVRSLSGVWKMLCLLLIVCGGLYVGVFTPNEAGAIGAFGALCLGLLSGRLTRVKLAEAFKETVLLSCFIMTMIIGANMFNTFLGVTGITSAFSHWITGIELSRYVILIGILFLYLPLGMFLDVGAMILLTVPLFVPPLTALGFNAIWLGVLVVIFGEVGFLTPPVGLNVFVVHGVTKVPVAEIFMGVMPFLLMEFIGIVILLIFPQIALFLPNLMG